MLAEVRSLLRARGRERTQWEIGSKAEPSNLVELLLERGVVRHKEPYAVALVLTEAPPQPPAGLVGHRAESFKEYSTANEVQ